MYDLTNLVNEQHDPFLEDLSCIGKSTDIAEAKDGDDLLSGEHRVHIVTLAHILTDNLRPSLTKADGKQAPDLL